MAFHVWLYATVAMYESSHEVLKAVKTVAKCSASKKR